MRRTNEKGTALIFALIFVLVLSTLAASLMFLSQSETWSSLNYRLMTQSRYGAEAGLHAAANYLTNTYQVPGTGVTDPLTAYNIGVSPVTLAAGNTPIVLGTAMNGLGLNYPVGSVQTAFNNAAAGSVTAGNNTVNYTVNAELMSMRKVRECGNAQYLTAQLWKLTSHGDISGVRNSEVEVSAILELHVTPCYNYAGYATGNGCSSIQFNGGGTIDSYDSSAYTVGSGSPTTQLYDGNLGSNGNANAAPNTTINGTFSSPDTGVGACSSGNVTAISGNTTSVTGCEISTSNCGTPLIKLPQATAYTTPTTDYPGCSGSGAASCDATMLSTLPNNPGLTLTPTSADGSTNLYGDIGLTGKATKVLTLNPYVDPVTNACSAGIFYINSITLGGNASMTIAPCPAGSVPAGSYQPIIVNIVGSGLSSGTVLDLGGNGVINSTYNSSLIQIQYAGTGAINIHGNGSTAAVVMAPNAPITLSGNGTVYGSVIGSTLTANGNPVAIHYDRALSANLATVGNWTMDTFTWSKF